MAAPTYGPCEPWATEIDLCSPCDDYTVDSALMDEFFQIATDFLYYNSAQQFRGECSITIRPCTQRSFSTIWANYPTLTFHPLATPVCGCGQDDTCGCSNLSFIELPYTPVTEVTGVKVDGVELDEEDYRVDDYRYLVRLDDEVWPCCQDISKPDTEEDTWSVTFTYGLSVPAMGRRAAAVLACELYMACNPEEFEGQCRLPRNVVQLVRNNISVAMENPASLFRPIPGQPIRTGLTEVDMFLATYNPYGLTAPSVVLSPDLVERHKRVGT